MTTLNKDVIELFISDKCAAGWYCTSGASAAKPSDPDQGKVFVEYFVHFKQRSIDLLGRITDYTIFDTCAPRIILILLALSLSNT